MRPATAVIIISLLFLSGCGGGRDPRLVYISEIVSCSPMEALSALDSISCGSLSGADRHFHDFLSVKAKDKAYIVHESDSLILDVVSYYEDSGLYPEALYYAGRVYSDMGDYPSALEYFQKSLDNIPDGTMEMTDLKGRVVSQTARLLNRLRLYDRAIPYLHEALLLDSIMCDTFNLAYDNAMLGAVHRHLRNIPEATRCYGQASCWARHLTPMDQANMQMQLAGTKLYGGDIDSAVTLIRGIPGRVRPIQRNEAMIYASDIYLAAGILDSAYFYADRLVHSPEGDNRKNGYRNLFSPELFGMIPPDSIPVFVRDYYSLLESYYNDNDAQRAMMQDAFYNYRLHQREREKADQRSRRFILATFILTVVVLVAAVVILYLRYRRKTILLRLHTAIHELETLRKSMSSDPVPSDDSGSFASAPGTMSEMDVLRSRLLEQVEMLRQQTSGRPPVDPAILKSDVMKTVGQYLADNMAIPDRSPLWHGIEQMVLCVSPHFKDHLQLLAGQPLKEQDYRVALLIRCGVTPSQMTILLGRTKGTISYRRRHFCGMMMGSAPDSQSIDSIIRCI